MASISRTTTAQIWRLHRQKSSYLLQSCRTLASHAPSPPSNLNVFDKRAKFLQRERAAGDVEGSRKVDYLRTEVTARLVDRLLDINRDIPQLLSLSSTPRSIIEALTSPSQTTPEADLPASRISHLTIADTCQKHIQSVSDAPPLSTLDIKYKLLQSEAEETALPFSQDSFDAVISSLSLHWINDLPTHLSSIRSVLKPDAPFLGAFFGGDTLFELRTSLQLAELEREGGMGVHVSPFADVRDIGGLLTKAGFTLITVDIDDIIVMYPSMADLMQDLQAMGENNAAFARRTDLGALKKDVLLAGEGIYKELHGEEGGLPATFRIIYVIGWKEGPNQRKPLERGSATTNLKDILEKP